jgi:uncharacterized protein
MRPSEALARHREEIRRIVYDHRSSNPRVFGSVLHGEDAEGSDLRVDVLTPLSLPESYRGRVLGEARPV